MEPMTTIGRGELKVKLKSTTAIGTLASIALGVLKLDKVEWNEEGNDNDIPAICS